ncbi:MAG: filamentous hemagglutinin N-terminal domain-containing protein [Thiotrichaceae bacterium]|nr:filamentous hemagglutinin N-terminal domain-containing protein [Thiotrichaceae bacterium]PCI12426.1 MAG: hypothetical protein COB71_08940 [Thiotrichales bacterium]
MNKSFHPALYLCLSAMSVAAYCQETNITSSGLGTNINLPREDAGQSFYDITSASSRGGNLFFSFEQFNVGEGDVANFINPAALNINNIISRVTGEASVIHGEINSRAFGEAHFFLLNPSGITFGEAATLNVAGSFHLSTTDSVVFEDGTVFSAALPGPATLSSAAPVSFGFLESSTEAITIENSRLTLDSGKAFSLVAADIILVGGELRVTDGLINIEAQTLLMDKQSILQSSTVAGSAPGSEKNGIMINLVDGLALKNGSQITSGVRVEGIHAGDISITVDSGEVKIAGESPGLFFNTPSQINSSAGGGGIAGNISIAASKLELTDSGEIQATSSGLSEQSEAGDITLWVDELTIDQGGLIANRTTGSGAGGTTTINANTINIRGETPAILSATTGRGNAGNIMIRAKEHHLVIKGDGTISAESASDATGSAGSITIEAADLLMTDGVTLSANTSSVGRGGSIRVSGNNIEISNGVNLTAESLFVQGSLPLGSDAGAGWGESGSIAVTASNRLILDNSRINLNTQQADAGNIVIRAGRLFRMVNQSEITTSVAGGDGDGGNIRINETIDANIVILSDTSTLRANARQGAGGNINIKAYAYIISPDSVMDASAGPAGLDGVITVSTPDVDATTGILQLPDAFLDRSALLENRCALRTASNRSSFLISARGREPGPDALLVSDISTLVSTLDELPSTEMLAQLTTRCW